MTLQNGEPAAYVNFLTDEGMLGLREAYPRQTWERLTAIKASYDPTKLFRLNQNIPPVWSANLRSPIPTLETRLPTC